MSTDTIYERSPRAMLKVVKKRTGRGMAAQVNLNDTHGVQEVGRG
jgi:hypothetical protein